MRFMSLAVACACVSLAACGGWKSGQANSAQGNISQDSRPAATAKASEVTNGAGSNAMVMLAVPSVKGPDALRIMHERHEAMEQLGKSMKTLHRALDGGGSDMNVIRAQTATMASVAARIPSLFPAGTGPDAGKTRAKPEIWTQHDLFINKAKEFFAAAQAIDAAARTGDMNKVMAVHDRVDRACKACHDPFRAPEH
jgi:cytochrome c556